MEKKKFTNEMRDKCREGFPSEAYKQHPTKTFLTTIKAMYITERLNDVFGVGRWTIHTEIIERTNDYVLVQGHFESLDYDVIVPKQFGGHQTAGKNTEIADGYKSAFTDCMSKIASYFEIGIDVFKGKINTVNKPSNKSDNKTSNNANDTKKWLNQNTKEWEYTVKQLTSFKVELSTIKEHFNISKPNQEKLLSLLEEAVENRNKNKSNGSK